MLDVLVRIPGIRRGELVDFFNRFVVMLRSKGGDIIRCYLPDTGSLARMMPAGTPVYYVYVIPRLGRFTNCDVVALGDVRSLILVDSRLPNIVFSKLIPRIFGDVDVSSGVTREVQVKAPFLWYRADFIILGYGREPLVVEVKGVNYAENGVGLFPSAKSNRASLQLEALKFLVQRGGARSMLVFIALRGDVKIVRPNEKVDPKFASRLCSYRHLIEYRAYRVRGELRGSTLFVYYDGEVPVDPCTQTYSVGQENFQER